MTTTPSHASYSELATSFVATVPDHATPTDCPTTLTGALHLINGEHYSGAERVQDLLGLSLDKFGYQVSFAALKDGKFAANRRSTCDFHLELMRGRWDWGITGRLLQLVESQDFKILHAHTPRTLMVGAALAKRTGLPLVYHVHSPVGRDSTRWLQNKINLLVERRSLRQAAHLIAVSDSVGQYMNEMGYGNDRLTAVPNGVPVVSTETRTALAAQKTWTSPWQTTLGTVALFRPRKGTEILLQALARWKAAGRDIGVLAVGGFETEAYQAHLKQLTQQLGIEDRVHWTGFTRDVNSYFPSMDIFVLPSLFGEGLPMVVLESMAMGIPVVASDVEGIQQAIRDRIDGRIARPGDVDSLAQIIPQMVDTVNLQEMGESAALRQRESFSDLSMCRATAAVYDRLLK